jgi:hypothetical protein
VQCINDLNIRGLPPIFQIVKNLAEELADKEFNYNWVSRFTERKKKILKNVCLITIAHERKIPDNSRHYEHFFENVRLLFYYVSSALRVIFITEVLSF